MKTENFFYKNTKDFTGTLEERDALLQQSLGKLRTKKQVKNIEHKTLFDYIGDTLERNTSYRKSYTVKITNADTEYIGSLVSFEDGTEKFYLWTYWGENYGTITGEITKPAGYSYRLAPSAGKRYIKEVLTCWIKDRMLTKDATDVAGKDYYELSYEERSRVLEQLDEFFKER